MSPNVVLGVDRASRASRAGAALTPQWSIDAAGADDGHAAPASPSDQTSAVASSLPPRHDGLWTLMAKSSGPAARPVAQACASGASAAIGPWLIDRPVAVVSIACVAPAPPVSRGSRRRRRSPCPGRSWRSRRARAAQARRRPASRIDGDRRVVRTPEATAAITADSPTPPAPNTTSDDSGAAREHVEHGPHAGLHAAAERSGDAEIDLLADHDDVRLVRQRVRREARLPEVRPVHA